MQETPITPGMSRTTTVLKYRTVQRQTELIPRWFGFSPNSATMAEEGCLVLAKEQAARMVTCQTNMRKEINQVLCRVNLVTIRGFWRRKHIKTSGATRFRNYKAAEHLNGKPAQRRAALERKGSRIITRNNQIY